MIAPYQPKETHIIPLYQLFLLNSLHLIVFNRILFDSTTPKSMLANI